MYTAKSIIVEVGLAKDDTVDYEAKRGILWVGRTRVAEWSTPSEKLVWKDESLKAAGLNVESKFLDDALKEKLRRE